MVEGEPEAVSKAGQHRFQIVQDNSGRKTKNPESPRLKPGRSTTIVANPVRVLVNLTVDLQRKPERRAKEVQDVGTDGMLSPKAEITEPTTPKSRPKQAFGQGQPPTELASARDGELGRLHEYNLNGYEAPVTPFTAVPAVPLPLRGRN